MVGLKKIQKYLQGQINEVCEKILYDDDRFENMRQEILNQRNELSAYKAENDELKNKVHSNMNIFDNVYHTLDKISVFRDDVEKERASILEIVKKSQNDCNVLYKKFSSLKSEVNEYESDTKNRLVKLEVSSNEHENCIQNYIQVN